MSSSTDSGPSLVLGSNNCNSGGESATRSNSPEQLTLDQFGGDESDGRYDCRQHYNYPDMGYVPADDPEAEKKVFRCGSWDCYCCGYHKRMNLVEEVQRVVKERPEMRRFLTLTLDPKALPPSARDDDEYQAEYIMETWRKFRTYIKREYGDFSFIWVKEKQENDNWHLHVLVSRYLDQAWISRSWEALGGGEIVDIRRVNRVEKAAHYLGKYLTKDALSEFPDHVKRYGTSEDIDLDVNGSSDSEEEWELVIDDDAIGSEGRSIRREVVPADFIHDDEPPPD